MTHTEHKSRRTGEIRTVDVLIIEDHPDGRASLQTLLEYQGYEVEVAADGAEGLEKGVTLRPQVALVDIGLPILDGFEVARRLRAVLGQDIRLLACTAYGQPEIRQRALEAGFDALQVKPLDLDRLMEWIEESLGH